MNKPVKFELAKLLKEKGWNTPTLHFYFEDGEFKENVLKDVTGMDYGSEYTVEYSELTDDWNNNYIRKKNGDSCFGCQNNPLYFKTYSAPTIAEVVMWLYEKHGIWIVAFPELFNGTEVRFYPSIFEQGVGEDIEQYFNSPSETYEAAIEYCLTKLI